MSHDDSLPPPARPASPLVVPRLVIPPGTTLPGTTLPGTTLPATTLPGTTPPGTTRLPSATAPPATISPPGAMRSLGATLPGTTRPITTQAARAAGHTRGELRSSRWRTPYRGLHVPASASSDDVRQRIVEAAELLPSAGAVGGWAAAHLLGAAVSDGLAGDGKGLLPVPLVVAPTHHPRPQEGVVWRREPLPSADVVLVDGIPVTVGPRTGFDLIRVNDLVEAVVCADAMLRAEIVDVAMLEEEIRRRRRWRGVLTARRALRLADAGAQSPQESRMRMVWVLGGLPVPVVNRPVFDLYGDYLGSSDFLDVEAAVAGEYDGATHRRLGDHTRDNAREERFEDHGLIVVRATSIDLHQRPNLFERFYRARERGLHRDRRRDQWTLDPVPPWLVEDAAPDLPW